MLMLNLPVNALVESEHERHASDQWVRLTIPPSENSPASSITTEATTSPLSLSPFPITAAPTPEATPSFQGLQPRPKLAISKTIAIHSTSPSSPSTGSSIRVSTMSDSLSPSPVAITPNGVIDLSSQVQNPVSALTNDGTIAANSTPISTSSLVASVTLHTSTKQTNSSPSPTIASPASTSISIPPKSQDVGLNSNGATLKEPTDLLGIDLTPTMNDKGKTPSASSTIQISSVGYKTLSVHSDGDPVTRGTSSGLSSPVPIVTLGSVTDFSTQVRRPGLSFNDDPSIPADSSLTHSENNDDAASIGPSSKSSDYSPRTMIPTFDPIPSVIRDKRLTPDGILRVSDQAITLSTSGLLTTISRINITAPIVSASKTGISHYNSSANTLATIIVVKINDTATVSGHNMTMSGPVHEPLITATTTVKYESAKPADSTGCRLHLGVGRLYWIAVGVAIIFVWAMELLT